jgi:hypothetical protein
MQSTGVKCGADASKRASTSASGARRDGNRSNADGAMVADMCRSRSQGVKLEIAKLPHPSAGGKAVFRAVLSTDSNTKTPMRCLIPCAGLLPSDRQLDKPAHARSLALACASLLFSATDFPHDRGFLIQPSRRLFACDQSLLVLLNNVQ